MSALSCSVSLIPIFTALFSTYQKSIYKIKAKSLIAVLHIAMIQFFPVLGKYTHLKMNYNRYVCRLIFSVRGILLHHAISHRLTKADKRPDGIVWFNLIYAAKQQRIWIFRTTWHIKNWYDRQWRVLNTISVVVQGIIERGIHEHLIKSLMLFFYKGSRSFDCSFLWFLWK